MIAVVLGDQLDLESPALEACDAVIMVEAAEESRRVRSHKARTILFFSAMRHFAASLRERGLTVHYRSIEQGHQGSLVEQILELAGSQTDAGLRMLEPGDWSIEQAMREACQKQGRELLILDDPQALSSREDFKRYAHKRSQ